MGKTTLTGIFIFYVLLYVHCPALGQADCVIFINAYPPLPFDNLLSNPDFEEDFASWEQSSKNKSRLLINDLDSVSGKSSILIVKKETEESTGVYQNCKQLEKGNEYIISCDIKGDDHINNSGGVFTGVGITFGIYDGKWEKSLRIDARARGSRNWTKLVSAPFTIPSWAENFQFVAGISYTKGIALIDNVILQKAYTALTFSVKGENLSQVILENDKGVLVYDSGELPLNTTEFSTTLKVLSPYVYTVRVINTKGNIYKKSYPSAGNPGNKIKPHQSRK